MKRQHILIMHMHIHPLTLSVAYIFRKNLYNLNMTSTGTVMWSILSNQRREHSREQSREQSKAKTAILIFIFILSLTQIKSNQIISNQIKDILLDSDDNLLYDSDSIAFDSIWFDSIPFDRMARFLFIMMTIEVKLIL